MSTHPHPNPVTDPNPNPTSGAGPASGLIERICGLFEGLGQAFAPGGPPKTNPWAFLRQSLWPMRWALALSVSAAVVSAILELWFVAFAGRLVDTLDQAGADQVWAAHGTELTIAALVYLALRPVVMGLREITDDMAVHPTLTTLVGWRAHGHVARQSVGWFQDTLSGRVAQQVREIGRATADSTFDIFHSLTFITLYAVGSLYVMAAIDPRLALPLLAWFVAYGLMMVWAIPRYQTRSERYQDEKSELTGHVVDTYTNIETVALFADAQAEDRASLDAHARMLRAHRGLNRMEVGINVINNLSSSILPVALVSTGVWLWMAGEAGIGIVATALALSLRIAGLAEWLLDAVAELFESMGNLRAALKVVAQPHAITDAPGARALALSGGGIRISGLTHHYGKGAGGLAGIDLSIAPGERVGLVGPSGAGKSTLVKLLLRFYEAEGGDIEIDGQNIRTVTQASLRAAVGMVAQEASLLHRSLRDNIALGRPEATDARIEAATTRAAADFIPDLVDAEGRTGLDAFVGERGVKLSGGQRQRIALARVILKDAPILILDEATSALDSEVEAKIQHSLYDAMKGKTVIAIAHRLSTISHMDRIVVMDAGRIVETGSHDDLLAQGGLYAKLWSRQSGGFIGTEAAQ